MASIEERENLMKGTEPSRTGFTPRHATKLATRKKPRTTLNIECNHFIRASADNTGHGYQPIAYRLWLEAGKHEAPFPERPDPNYNSNVWRNFRQQYGFSVSAEGRKMDELIASMYPVNVPCPSKVGPHSYAKFVKETPALVQDKKYKKMIIARSEKDVQEFKEMRLKADLRNPPISESGKILPPRNFKKYAHRFIPPEEEPRNLSPPPDESTLRTDIFGARVKKLSKPHLYKLGYKLNNPEFEQVLKLKEGRQTEAKRFTPAISLVKTS